MAPCPPTASKCLSIYEDFRAVSAFTYAIRPLLPDGHGVQSAIASKGGSWSKPNWLLVLSSRQTPDGVASADGVSKGGGGEAFSPKQGNTQTPPEDMEPSALAALSGVYPEQKLTKKLNA